VVTSKRYFSSLSLAKVVFYWEPPFGWVRLVVVVVVVFFFRVLSVFSVALVTQRFQQLNIYFTIGVNRFKKTNNQTKNG